MSATLRDCEPNYNEIWRQFKNKDEHKVPLDKLIKKLETDASNGLTSKQAETKLKEYGPNNFQKPKKLWVIALITEASALYQVYFAISAVCLFCYMMRKETPQPMHTAVMLLTTAILITIYSFIKYGSAPSVTQTLLPSTTKCKRDGAFKNVPTSELVPGDIIQVNAGERIGADARVISAERNAGVTYKDMLENDQTIRVSAEARPSEDYWESTNIVLRGGLVTEGSITAVVTSTGEATILGKLLNATAGASYLEKPVLRKINKMINVAFLIEIGIGFAYLIVNKTPAKVLRA